MPAGTTLTVRATSVSNTTVYREATVTVTPLTPAPTFTLNLGTTPITGSGANPTKLGSGNLSQGQTATMTAGAPRQGYRFVRFDVIGGTLSGLNPTARTVTFTMGTEKATITAVYERSQHQTQKGQQNQ